MPDSDTSGTWVLIGRPIGVMGRQGYILPTKFAIAGRVLVVVGLYPKIICESKLSDWTPCILIWIYRHVLVNSPDPSYRILDICAEEAMIPLYFIYQRELCSRIFLTYLTSNWNRFTLELCREGIFWFLSYFRSYPLEVPGLWKSTCSYQSIVLHPQEYTSVLSSGGGGSRSGAVDYAQDWIRWNDDALHCTLGYTSPAVRLTFRIHHHPTPGTWYITWESLIAWKLLSCVKVLGSRWVLLGKHTRTVGYPPRLVVLRSEQSKWACHIDDPLIVLGFLIVMFQGTLLSGGL